MGQTQTSSYTEQNVPTRLGLSNPYYCNVHAQILSQDLPACLFASSFLAVIRIM